MGALLFLGALGWALFEIANVYFIMPMPGSQRMASLDVAHFLHTWRWGFRVVFAVLMLTGFAAAWRGPLWRKAVVVILLAVAGGVTWLTNRVMAADAMFQQPRTLTMAGAADNTVDRARLVVGVVQNGEARAYPIQFIGYHHQVRDVVGGVPVMVTYCTVCRTGRVFSPQVDGRDESFRLVGMDHFNAMFEDRTTGSWWRQATGQAVAGPRKGSRLTELASIQVSLDDWLALHPNTLVMQADAAFADRYARSFDFESGASRSALTGTDPASWGEKSWVVGIELNGASKAFDWNRLRRERVINDVVGGTPIVIVLLPDDRSFLAFERPDAATRFELRGDSLISGSSRYALGAPLVPVQASQEFWHSWRTFHPGTERY
jgi:hypothetical protein